MSWCFTVIFFLKSGVLASYCYYKVPSRLMHFLAGCCNVIGGNVGSVQWIYCQLLLAMQCLLQCPDMTNSYPLFVGICDCKLTSKISTANLVIRLDSAKFRKFCCTVKSKLKKPLTKYRDLVTEIVQDWLLDSRLCDCPDSDSSKIHH